MSDYQRSIKSALFVVLVCVSFSCSNSSDSSVERVKVSGLVYYDGDPLSNARILFISETPDGTVKSSGVVRQGIYQIQKPGGPSVGKARVEIYPKEPELEEFLQSQKAVKQKKGDQLPHRITIPEIYNKNSQLTANITKDGKNSFEFKLVSK